LDPSDVLAAMQAIMEQALMYRCCPIIVTAAVCQLGKEQVLFNGSLFNLAVDG
jgi:hypothetical protein